MSSPFVAQSMQESWTDTSPLEPPEVRDPARRGWRNLGLELYREVFGDEDFERFSRADRPVPMPEPSAGLRRQMRWRVFKAQMMFGTKALLTGRRATHMRGAGGRGVVRIVADPQFPEHDFFQAGREFPCRLRHANASFYDDASIQVRGCALKFADSRCRSPLDIIMNSGATSAFWNFDSFMAFVKARLQCRENFWTPQQEFMRVLPAAFVGTIESVRHAPGSWADVTYYGKFPYPFLARDGRRRYIKYRIVRQDLEQEAGLISPDIQRQPWVQCRLSGDDRPTSYLTREYHDRISRGPIAYLLQIQLREWDDRQTSEFFNLSRYWDESEFPWIDLAHVEIRDPLPAAEIERTRMWLGHQPASLGLTSADSVVDYRSLAWSRYHIYPRSQQGRWLLRRLGMKRRLPADF